MYEEVYVGGPERQDKGGDRKVFEDVRGKGRGVALDEGVFE